MLLPLGRDHLADKGRGLEQMEVTIALKKEAGKLNTFKAGCGLVGPRGSKHRSSTYMGPNVTM